MSPGIPPIPEGLLDNLPPLSENSKTVLTNRYLAKDDSGQICETHDELFWRVAWFVAAHGHLKGSSSLQAIEDLAKSYFLMLRSGDFLPNSPTLANAGTRTGQLSACFVLPVDDAFSNEKGTGIYDTLKDAQLIQQTGGGVGFSFSRLRRKGALVKTTKGVSSGPVSFADVYDRACDAMKQGGTRRGAQMLILRVDHPDILEFIDEKQDLTKLTNFNVSVAVTDEFLEALETNADYYLVNPEDNSVHSTLNSREVWNRIVTRAHATGEPGVVFIDRMNRHNPTPLLGPYEATNPCGEQPLNPYESCNLGSITLDNMIAYDTDGNPYVDDEKLRNVTWLATQFMDDVVDANEYVARVPRIREVTLLTRKLGLGIMGLARMLCKLGLAYNTPEGRKMSEQVYAFVDYESKAASVALAKRLGAYPYFLEHTRDSVEFFTKDLMARASSAKESGFFELAEKYILLTKDISTYGIRNSTTTTIAPTGTISMVADTSGGCEPLFALSFKRFQADTEMYEVDKVFLADLEQYGFSQEHIDLIVRTVDVYKGSLIDANRAAKDSGFNTLAFDQMAFLEKLSKVYVVAGDITPEDHILMQAALQKYCDSSISKTVNAPEEYTVEQTAQVYDLALTTGCKGVTIYRNNSRKFQPLQVSGSEIKPDIPKPEDCPNCKGMDLMSFGIYAGQQEAYARTCLGRPRPSRMFGFSDRVETPEGSLYVQVNYDNQGIREVVANLGKGGGILSSLVEAIGRLISIALKHRTPVSDLSRSLRGIRGGDVTGFGPNKILSIPDALGKVLEKAPPHIAVTVVDDPESDPDPKPQPELTTVLHKSETIPVDSESVTVIKANGRKRALDPVTDLGKSPECSKCGGRLVHAEGCETCPSCQTSRCG